MQELEDLKGARRGDGGTYLVVADESDEFDVALRYALRLAEENRGHLAVLHVIETGDFQDWSAVERMMRKELREKAEMFLWSIAKKVNDINGISPSLRIGEGARAEVLLEAVADDPRIVMLILGGGTGLAGPSPLVSYFTGKGIARLRVPVLVVPENLDTSREI